MSQTFHDIVHTSFGLNFWISKKYFNEVPVDEFGWKTKEFSNRFGLNFWISKKYFNEVPVAEFGWKTKEFSIYS